MPRSDGVGRSDVEDVPAGPEFGGRGVRPGRPGRVVACRERGAVEAALDAAPASESKPNVGVVSSASAGTELIVVAGATVSTSRVTVTAWPGSGALSCAFSRKESGPS